MAQPSKQPKAMSSRLLTMKFMQRAAASPSPLPSTPPEPAAKRQRHSNGSYQTTPSSGPGSDAQVVEETLAADEQKRIEVLDREAAADRGETKWYLSYKEPRKPVKESPLRIISAGYSSLDTADSAKEPSSGDEGATRPSVAGRRSFGRFNKTVEKQQDQDKLSSAEESESAEEDNDDESDGPTGTKAMTAQVRSETGGKARAECKAKTKADKAEATRLADERRKETVNLDTLASISGGLVRLRQAEICHQCGRKGHIQRTCPRTKQHRLRRR